ncbi:hypothetical protein GCM10028803_60450 [Larkinella knui]|uniref:Uncharacterized protein n=1 Tax=Larkinella knui TaxID=2025310 RepID=A0A3P1CC40_9BACT|nr:hypothetical protein [Larkinella knui]RRB10384.1 hypothetical protein EHT87_29615 [Larkinella knui]
MKRRIALENGAMVTGALPVWPTEPGGLATTGVKPSPAVFARTPLFRPDSPGTRALNVQTFSQKMAVDGSKKTSRILFLPI